MTILITGSLGFIGFNLSLFLLKKGFMVFGIDSLRNTNNMPFYEKRAICLRAYPNWEFLSVDLNQTDRLLNVLQTIQPHIIVHLAAFPGVADSVLTPDLYISNNVGSTHSLLKAIQDIPLEKLIFASSSTVYQNKTSGTYSETDVLLPLTAYAQSKLQCETLINLSPHKSIIFRLFSVYGEHIRPDLFLFKLMNAISAHSPLTIYDTNTQRDFTFIDDVLQAFYKAILLPQVTGIFNIGAGVGYSLKTIINTMETISNTTATYQLAPARNFELTHTKSNSTKAQQLLDWTPSIPLLDGLQRTWNWFKQEQLCRKSM